MKSRQTLGGLNKALAIVFAAALGAVLAQYSTSAAHAQSAEIKSADASPAIETARKEPKRLIEFQYTEFDKLVASGLDVEALRASIVLRMDDFVDFEEFSRLTVKEQWDGFTADQRTEYVRLFKQLIQRTYAKKFKPDSRLAVTYRGDAEVKAGKARLQTAIASGGIEADVEYRFHQLQGRGWWVYDIVIDDVSLMRNYRSQFQRIVKSDGVEGLFSKLREKVDNGEE